MFLTFPRETVTFHYERRPQDPRVGHDLIFEVDSFANVLRGASAGYGRRPGFADPVPELSAAFRAMLAHDQPRLHLSATEHRFTKNLKAPDDPTIFDAYRAPMPSETKPNDGVTPAGARLGSTNSTVARSAGNMTSPGEDEASTPDLTAGRRVVQRSRILYRRDDLPFCCH